MPFRQTWDLPGLQELEADSFTERADRQIRSFMSRYTPPDPLPSFETPAASLAPATPSLSLDLKDWTPWNRQPEAPPATETPTTGGLSFNLADWAPWHETPKPAPAASIPGPDQTPQGTPVRSAGEMAAPAQTGDLRAYTRAKAQSLGIDPDVAERVFGEGEGGFDDPVRQSDVVYQGQRERSYGPAQLNIDGGLGAEAIRRGHDPRDPANVYRNIDFALETAAKGGWGPWHGAARIGIGNWQGIGTVAPGSAPAAPQQSAAGGPSDADRYDVAFGFNQAYDNPFNPNIPRHRGVDLVVRGGKDGGRGSPVTAFRGGTVFAVTNDPNGGNGLIVATGDPDAPYDYYGHFDATNVKQGQQIQPGEPIGVLGASGTEGFPHLHYEVRRAVNGDPMDQLIDPTPYMHGGGRPTQTAGASSRAPAAPSPQPPAAQAPTQPAAAGGIPGLPPVPAGTPDPVFVRGKYDQHWEARSYVQANPGDYQIVYDPQAGGPTAQIGQAATGAPMSLKTAEPMPEDASDSERYADGLNTTLPTVPPPMRNEVPFNPETGQAGWPGMQRAPLDGATPVRDNWASEPGYTSPGGGDGAPAVGSTPSGSRETVTGPMPSTATQPVTAVPTPYDPRDADQGAHEAPAPAYDPRTADEAPGARELPVQPPLPQQATAPDPVYGPVDPWTQPNPLIPGNVRPSDLPERPGQEDRSWRQPPPVRTPGLTIPDATLDRLVPRYTQQPATTSEQYIPTAPPPAGGLRQPQYRRQEPAEDAAAAIEADRQYQAGPPSNPLERVVAATAEAPFLRETPADQAVAIYNAITELPFDAYAVARRQLISDAEAKRVTGTDPIAPLRAAFPDAPWPSVETLNPAGRPAGDVLMGLMIAGALPDPTDPLVATAFRGAGQAIRGAGALGRVVGRGAGAAADAAGSAIRGAGRALEEGRATARALNAAPGGGTVLPGTLGISPDENMMRGLTRPRVIPPEVADTLDQFPVRVPDDPATVRAIEAVGGTVDPERGVTLTVTRAQAPSAAGGAATRGGVFYEAVPEGGRSSYAGMNPTDDPHKVGGTQVIPPQKTRFRSPLILSDAPGGSNGFEQGARELGIAGPDGGPLYNWDIDDAVRAARAAGPEGSPARAQALKDVVSRYGGDPNLIDDLLAIRGADASESAWAIKENILAANARKQGYDGVVTVQPRVPAPTEIDAHPAVKAALEERFGINKRLGQIVDAIDARAKELPPGLSGDEIHQDPKVAALVDEYNRLYQRLDEMPQAIEDARTQAYRELSTSKITELMDPREARNPTPGAPLAESLTDLNAKVQAARENWRTLASSGASPDEMARATAEVKALEDAWDRALSTGTFTGPSGYALREDVPRRPETRASTIEANPRLAAAERAYQAGIDRGAPSSEMDRLWEDLIDARSEGDFTTANASAGALPRPPGSDMPLSTALGSIGRAANTEALNAAGGGVAGMAVSGDLTPSENDTRTPEQRARDAALHFGVGALGAVGLRHGGRAIRRGAQDGGALATLGVTPNAQPVLQRFPGVQRAIQGANQRATRMAANPNGPQALSPLQWTRRLIGTAGYSSMIGPSTATVNLFGNALELAWAGPKELARSVVRGNPREAATMLAGTFRGMGQVGEAMRDAIMARGRYALNPDSPMLSAQTVNPIGHAVAAGLEFGGRVFSGMPDAIFATIARSAGEAREAAQIATDMGLKGDKWKSYVEVLLKDADAQRGMQPGGRYTSANAQRVIKAGEEYADRQTFRDQLGTIGKGASRLAGRDVPVVGNMLTPFFNTPWNMELRRLERSPLGLAMNSQPTRFDKYYDALAGSALIGAVAFWPAAMGAVTGSGPSDPEKRKMLEAEGWKPYHTFVPIGEGYYVPNRVFGIYGQLLNAAGDVHDAMAYQKKDAGANAIGDDAMRRIGNALKEEPYLQGLADIFGMFGANGGADALSRYGSSLATRMVPYGATTRAIGTAADPYEREVDRGKGVTPGETFTQRVEQGLGMRSDLPVAQNAMGEPKPNPQQGLSAVLPKTAARNSQPVVRAYLDGGVDIPAPPPTVEGVQLSPAQKRRYQAVMGKELERVAGPAVRAETWKSIPPAQKTVLLETYRDIARTLASASIQAEGGAQYWQDYAKAQVEKAGVAP